MTSETNMYAEHEEDLCERLIGFGNGGNLKGLEIMALMVDAANEIERLRAALDLHE